MEKLIREYKEITNTMDSMETGLEYTEEAVDKMNDRLTQIAFTIIQELVEGRYIIKEV